MTGGYRFEVTVAPPAVTVPGTRVVGFREYTGAAFSERILPRPSFGIVLDCTPGSVSMVGATQGASGLVGGMAPHAATVTGASVDCLEIQLSPLVARRLLDQFQILFHHTGEGMLRGHPGLVGLAPFK